MEDDDDRCDLYFQNDILYSQNGNVHLIAAERYLEHLKFVSGTISEKRVCFVKIEKSHV